VTHDELREAIERVRARRELTGLGGDEITLTLRRPRPPTSDRVRLWSRGGGPTGEVLNAKKHPDGGWNITAAFDCTSILNRIAYLEEREAKPRASPEPEDGEEVYEGVFNIDRKERR
jgi:hypothetical protein